MRKFGKNEFLYSPRRGTEKQNTILNYFARNEFGPHTIIYMYTRAKSSLYVNYTISKIHISDIYTNTQHTSSDKTQLCL